MSDNDKNCIKNATLSQTNATCTSSGVTDHPWMVSLHGGHSGEFCDHAEGLLADIVEQAYARGFTTYGVTEHAPRLEPGLLYEEEKQMGWTNDRLVRMFDDYAARLAQLEQAYRGRLELLRGFEAEVIPREVYVERALGLKRQYNFDYLVGSVHFVAGYIIDYRKDHFDAACNACGGLERMCVAYYRDYAAMCRDLRPEVAAHFDLVRRNAPDEASVATPAIREAAFAALQDVKASGAILDINTGAYRKGFGRPYPAPWILQKACRLGVPVCFGDDSHRPSEVGSHFAEARAYLLAHGYTEITALRRGDTGLVQTKIAL